MPNEITPSITSQVEQTRISAGTESTRRLYACTETLKYFWDASNLCGTDVHYAGLGPELDGVYRLVDGVYLAWMRRRIEQYLQASFVNSGERAESIGRAIAFYHEVRDASGLEPVTPELIP